MNQERKYDFRRLERSVVRKTKRLDKKEFESKSYF